jgi:mannose PTS system EIIA component
MRTGCALDNAPMADLIIIAHAPLASSLKVVARHVFADAGERIAALDVQAEDRLESVEREARALIARSAATERLVLVDVFGATPYNVAQRLTDLPGTRVIAGVNVPMLWRALSYQHLPLDQLVERAHSGAVQGVIVSAASRPQNQSPAASANHDPTQRHHQQ